MAELPTLITIKDKTEAINKAKPWLASALQDLLELAQDNGQLMQYVELVKKDVIGF